MKTLDHNIICTVYVFAVFSGQDFEEYLGIRYAAPPVGDLRWEKPQLPEPWDEVVDTVEFGSPCFQFEGNDTEYSEFDEDCLFLNVFVPGMISQFLNGTGCNLTKLSCTVHVHVHA